MMHCLQILLQLQNLHNLHKSEAHANMIRVFHCYNYPSLLPISNFSLELIVVEIGTNCQWVKFSGLNLNQILDKIDHQFIVLSNLLEKGKQVQEFRFQSQ